MKGWHGERRRHSLASKGVKTSDLNNLSLKVSKDALKDEDIKLFLDELKNIIEEWGLGDVHVYTVEDAPENTFKISGYYDGYDFIIFVSDESNEVIDLLNAEIKKSDLKKRFNVFFEPVSYYTIGVVTSKNKKHKSYKKSGHAIGDRIGVSKDVLGDLPYSHSNVIEGKHYSTLATTDWADEFVPTIVEWNHGAVDDFSDRDKSFENYKKALEYGRK